MDQHPTPFPGKTRRSVATSSKAKPEQGKGGGREPSVVAARYDQPQRRVFGTLRCTNAKVDDNIASQKPQHPLAKSGTKPRRPAFVLTAGSLKKQTNDNSPKDQSSRQAGGFAEAKKKHVAVSFREPLPGKGAGGNDDSSTKDSKEQCPARKSVAVCFIEPLQGKSSRGDSPTEPNERAGSSEGKKRAVTKDPGSSERKRSVATVKQTSSGPEGKKPAARDHQPAAAAGKRSVGSASRIAKTGANDEPRTPAPASAAAALQAAVTPYLSARDCSKCRLDRLETASYWIAQIKLAESSGKHYVAAAFFRLAFKCNAEPFRRLKSELSSYVQRHLTVSNTWPDVCRLYSLLEDEPAGTLEPRVTAADDLGKARSAPAQREATSEDPGAAADVAALLALEGEVTEKCDSSGAGVRGIDAECGVACQDCCDHCLVPGTAVVETVSTCTFLECADENHLQDRDRLTGNSPTAYSVRPENYCETTSFNIVGPSEGDSQTEAYLEPSRGTSGAGVSPNAETADECQGPQ